MILPRNSANDLSQFSSVTASRFAATLLGKGDEVLASSEARLGTESEPGNVYYPIPPEVLPEKTVSSVSAIEIANDKKSKVRVKAMKLCMNGTEIHYHFR